jgi:hypothetical protein
MKLVTVTNKNQLPFSSREIKGITSRPFVVLKTSEDGKMILIKVIGGIDQSGHKSCWWVDKVSCKSAYKKGQRWRYTNGLIVEFISDDFTDISNQNVKVMQKGGSGWKDRDIFLIDVDTPDCEYLEGQDAPLE